MCVCVFSSEREFIFVVQYAEAHITDLGKTMRYMTWHQGPNSPPLVKAETFQTSLIIIMNIDKLQPHCQLKNNFTC